MALHSSHHLRIHRIYSKAHTYKCISLFSSTTSLNEGTACLHADRVHAAYTFHECRANGLTYNNDWMSKTLSHDVQKSEYPLDVESSIGNINEDILPPLWQYIIWHL